MKLRFSIRELFWLILVAALMAGWWVDRSQLRRQLDAATDRYKTDELKAQVEELKQAYAKLGLRIKPKDSGSPQKQPGN